MKNAALYERLRNGDPTAREEVITDNMNLVYYHLHRIFPNGFGDMEDLGQEGMLGLIKAADTFDPGKGYAFSTYASMCIRNEIFMALRKINSRPKTVSIDDPLPNTDDYTTFRDSIPDTRKSYVQSFEDADRLRWAIRQIETMKPNRKREIVLTYLRGNGQISQGEVAKKFGTSRAYVSRAMTMARKLLEKREKAV